MARKSHGRWIWLFTPIVFSPYGGTGRKTVLHRTHPKDRWEEKRPNQCRGEQRSSKDVIRAGEIVSAVCCVCRKLRHAKRRLWMLEKRWLYRGRSQEEWFIWLMKLQVPDPTSTVKTESTGKAIIYSLFFEMSAHHYFFTYLSRYCNHNNHNDNNNSTLMILSVCTFIFSFFTNPAVLHSTQYISRNRQLIRKNNIFGLYIYYIL